MSAMSSRFLAILLLVLLTVLPAAGGALAFPAAGHCAPEAHAMTMSASKAGVAVEKDCEYGGAHRLLPCAMMGLCSMAGCMALMAVAMPEDVASGQRVSFRSLDTLRLDGLALSPPLEPPRT